MQDLLFPHENVRPVQEEMIEEVTQALEQKRHLIVHAPTGLGKTAATLAPALTYAIANKKTVFFLTSKHTQHFLAIETLRQIKKKFDLNFVGVDLIGKKWLCLIPGAKGLQSHDFAEYCKHAREKNECEFYVNTRKNPQTLTPKATIARDAAKILSPSHTEQIVELAQKEKLCPYYLSEHLAQEATVIVADYYYLFNPSIRKHFFEKIKKEPNDAIIIVDEGHNLPTRVRDLLTVRLTGFVLRNAVKEAKQFQFVECIPKLQYLQTILTQYAEEVKQTKEKLVKREDFLKRVELLGDYEELISQFTFAADVIHEQQRNSFIGSVAKFLEAWQQQGEGFTRIFSIKEDYTPLSLVLSLRCLDPAVVTKEVIENSHSTIIMSGTLLPTAMYKELLGFPFETKEVVFDSPFDEENKLSLIVPETTTKFTMRTDAQYQQIARVLAKITDAIPGNSLAFFPSYAFRDRVYDYFASLGGKTCILESPNLGKDEKNELLEKFKSYAGSGSVLLGAVSGNFSEGIDLPGDFVKGVVIVGLPLQVPDLETKELIGYYDVKYGKGYDYGYLLPTMTKIQQSAGRCIRSETDRGVVVYLDVRYSWPMYLRCFPRDGTLRMTKEYVRMIEEFFAM